MNKRIIRDEIEYFKSKEIYNLPPNSKTIHPLNVTRIINSDPINPLCLTKFQMDKNNNLNILNKYKCINKTNNYKKNLYVPVIGLGSSDLLNIYSINSIDSLDEFISNNLNILPFKTIERIINCWIRVNFETLKNYNNYLEKICWRFLEFHYKKIEKNEVIIKKEIKNFIDYWINKHLFDEFNLNLIKDIIDYLKKKKLL